MTEPVPKTQNWVKARAECSTQHLFMVLSAVVESDAKAANARGGDSLTFEVKKIASDSFLVSRQRNAGGFIESEAVAFSLLRDGSILVTHRAPQQNADLFVAKPHVDLQGDCRFEVDGLPLEPWQVSKRALENLFFQYGLSTDRQP